MLLKHRKQPRHVYIRQYCWPVFLPEVHQTPILNMNQFVNPDNLKFTQPSYHGYLFQQQISYMPCLIKQIVIPILEEYQQAHPCQTIIECHNYMPFNYC